MSDTIPILVAAACVVSACGVGPSTPGSAFTPSFNLADLTPVQTQSGVMHTAAIPIPSIAGSNNAVINAGDNYTVTFVAAGNVGIASISLKAVGGLMCNNHSVPPGSVPTFEIPEQTISLPPPSAKNPDVFQQALFPYVFNWENTSTPPTAVLPAVKAFTDLCGPSNVPLLGTIAWVGTANAVGGGQTTMALKVTVCSAAETPKLVSPRLGATCE
jgi:hypothetical protein